MALKEPFYHKPWVLNVGSALVTTFILWMITNYIPFDEWGYRFRPEIAKVWGRGSELMSVPRWGFWLWMFWLIFYVVRTFIITQGAEPLGKSKRSKILSYTKDIFYNTPIGRHLMESILWRWRWKELDGTLEICDLHSLCEEDDCPLVDNVCPYCRREYHPQSDLIIKALINRKINNNEFRDTLLDEKLSFLDPIVRSINVIIAKFEKKPNQPPSGQVNSSS